MYFYELIKKLVFDAPETPYVHYSLVSTEIDNPLTESKISVPIFSIVEDKRPDYVDLKASAFGLDTLLNAGVSLQECKIVSTSFLRETEKFMDSLKNAKV